MIIMAGEQHHKLIEILKYRDNQRLAVNNIQYTDARIFLSGDFLIIIKATEDGNIHHVHNLSEIKSYKTK